MARLRPAKRRGETKRLGGALLIDDCYNANPRSMEVMLRVLAETPAGRRIAVLGEMRELGERSEELHRRVGRAASDAGVDLLVGVTGAARWLVEEAAASGLPAAAAAFFEEPEAAGRFVAKQLRADDGVLFKASRGVALERAIETLKQEFEAVGERG